MWWRIATGLVVAALASVILPTAAQAQAQDDPNLLFLFADDMTYDAIAALGNDEILTPNLDQLVGRSTSFTNAYNQGAWTGAVCRSSRDMLESGLFLWNAFDEASTIRANGLLAPQVLGDNGYDTYFAGKLHMTGVNATMVSDFYQNVGTVRPAMPADSWSTDRIGYNRPIEGQPDPWSPSDPSFGGFWEGGTHWTEVLADEGIDFLQQAASDPDPFYMQLAFNAPHDPRQAPQEYLDMYPLENMSVPDNFMPLYPWAEEIGSGATLRDEALAPFPRTEYAVKVHRQEYYAAITYMDAQIGRVLDELETSGQLDDTYVMFSADHGLAVGQHGLIGKQNMFEHSMRSPLLLSGPTIPQNASHDTRLYYQDIMPTMFELAGITPPAHWQFRSLLPIIRGERSSNYDAVYGAYKNHQRMVVEDDHKLILYPDADVALLYDLNNDPLEMNDLFDDPAYADRRYDLFSSLIDLQVSHGDDLDLAVAFPELAIVPAIAPTSTPVPTATLVPTSTPAPTATPAPQGQGPYVVGGHTIPGVIEAEFFDTGGEGVAYSDATPANSGRALRTTEGVDIWNPFLTVNNTIGKIEEGEWLEYTVNVEDNALYSVEARVASGVEPGAMTLSIDGIDIGSIDVMSTGDWWTFSSASTDVSLTAGEHILRLTFTDGGNFNFDKLIIGAPTTAAASTPTSVPTPSPTATPAPTATPVPPLGPVPDDLAFADCGGLEQEAEAGQARGLFDVVGDSSAVGGSWVGVPEGVGNSYVVKPENVLAFCFDIANGGEYELHSRVIAPNSTSDSVFVQIDDGPIEPWHIRQTQTWAWRDHRSPGSRTTALHDLDAGQHVIKLYAREDGTQLDQIRLDLISPYTPIDEVEEGPTCAGLVQQGEFGHQTGSMATVADGAAESGHAVGMPEGSGNHYALNPANAVEYCVQVPADGDYRLVVRVLAPNQTSDSVYVEVDGQTPTVWHISQNADWRDRAYGTTYTLSAGEHRIRLIGREDGTMIDRVELLGI